MSQLFQPFKIGSLDLENRIVIAPMCQYSADEGRATDWHMMHLGTLALSGAGLLITEAAAVSPEGRITPDDLGLYSDETEAALGRVLNAMRTLFADPDRRATRPCGPQGLEPRALGRRPADPPRRPARLADRSPLGRCPMARASTPRSRSTAPASTA